MYYRKKYPYHPRLKEIRDIHNHSVGHPTDEGPGKTFNLITRASIGHKGFELGIVYRDNRLDYSEKVDIPDLIETQRSIFAPVLLDVIDTIGGEKI